MLSVLIEKDKSIRLDFRAINAGGTEHAFEHVNVLRGEHRRNSSEPIQ